MKKLLSILLMLALLAMLVLALGCAAAEEIPQYEGYNLVWNDEFDGEVFTFDDWNWETRRAVVFRTYENALRAGDKKVAFVDGQVDAVIGGEIAEFLHDATHLNDWRGQVHVTLLRQKAPSLSVLLFKIVFFAKDQVITTSRIPQDRANSASSARYASVGGMICVL